jgi:hypothetical protein
LAFFLNANFNDNDFDLSSTTTTRTTNAYLESNFKMSLLIFTGLLNAVLYLAHMIPTGMKGILRNETGILRNNWIPVSA